MEWVKSLHCHKITRWFKVLLQFNLDSSNSRNPSRHVEICDIVLWEDYSWDDHRFLYCAFCPSTVTQCSLWSPNCFVWKDKQHKGSIKWSRKMYTLKKAMCLIFKCSAPKSLPFYSIFTQNVESVLTAMGHPEYWSAASWTCCGKLSLRGQKDAGRWGGHDFKGGRCIKRKKCLQVGANPTETPKRLCPLTRGPHQPVFCGCPCIFKPLNLCVFFAICLAENPSNIHFIEQLGGLEGNLKENNLLLSTSFSVGTVFSGNFLDSLLATVSVVGSKRGPRPRGDWVS